MNNSPNWRGQKLLQSVTTVTHNTENLLNQLKEADIDVEVLNVLEEFFVEKAASEKPEDRKYRQGLAREIRKILKKYQGTDLKIILMQRLIVYGLNSPKLITYYYDGFVRLDKDVEPERRLKFVARLIKKTEVAELYRWYAEYPTLKESLQNALFARIKNIEKEKYGFYTVRGREIGPLHRLGVKPATFMYIYRSMEEAGILDIIIRRDPFFNYMSQVILSDEGEKLEPKTFRNRFVYEDIKHLDNAIMYVEKMKQHLIYAKEIELRR